MRTVQLSSVLRLLEMAAGGFTVGYVNDTFTAPALENALPSLQTNHMLAKATDTVSTAATAIVGGKALEAVGLDRVADAVKGGGLFVAALKALATPIDGAEVKLTTPSPLSLFRAQLSGGSASANAPAMGAGAPAAAQIGPGPNNAGYASAPTGSAAANSNAAATGTASQANSGYQYNPNGTFQNVPAPPTTNLDWGA